MVKEGYISTDKMDWINKNVINNQASFPWYLSPITVEGFKTNWPCMIHQLLGRCDGYKGGEITSPYYPFFTSLIEEICSQNGIKIKRFLRGAINCNFYHKIKHSHTHYDHDFDHVNIIIYLNKFSKGSTYLFKETSKEKPQPYLAKKVIKEIKADVGKYVIFPGENYHAAGGVGKDHECRIICIYNIETQK